MQILAPALLFFLSYGPSGADARRYNLIQDYTSGGVKGFFDSFDFFTDPDPTNGYVQYMDRGTAVSNALVGYTASVANGSNNAIYLGVDHSNPAAYPGRPSVRIASTATYNPGTLFITDIEHAPGGVCGVWPALWLLGTSAQWPIAGEIDIFEQVNLATDNTMTAHTDGGCSLRGTGPGRSFTGSVSTANCDVNAPDQVPNAGCSIDAPAGSGSFGAPFNAAGGGVYAAEWTVSRGFNIWFFPRSKIPASIAAGGGSIDTAGWGRPMGRFTGVACDWNAHFNSLQLVINTALCGDWAGGAWAEGGCAASTGVATCDEYVAGNPGAFQEAYWALGALRVYGNA